MKLEDALNGLFLAAQHGRADVIGAIVKEVSFYDLENSNPSLLFNKEGNNPLHIAVLYSKSDAVRILLTSGFPMNRTNRSDKKTPYQLAQAKNFKNIEQIFHEYSIQQIAVNNLLKFEECLACGIDVNSTDGSTHNNSFLHWAASCGALSILEILCKRGADVNIINSDHATPLHEAVLHNKIECIKVLLSYNARTDIIGIKGSCKDEAAKNMTKNPIILELFEKKNEVVVKEENRNLSLNENDKEFNQEVKFKLQLEEKDELISHLKQTIDQLVHEQEESGRTQEGKTILDYVRKIREENEVKQKKIIESDSYIEYQKNLLQKAQNEIHAYQKRIQELEEKIHKYKDERDILEMKIHHFNINYPNSRIKSHSVHIPHTRNIKQIKSNETKVIIRSTSIDNVPERRYSETIRKESNSFLSSVTSFIWSSSSQLDNSSTSLVQPSTKIKLGDEEVIRIV